MIPGCSRNCLRTSSTTVPAERPTARIRNDEARNAIDPPISIPMNVFGLATFISVATCWNSWFPVAWMFNCSPMVWMNAANRATAAITAEPMATPLVIALVVLPTASRLTIIFCGSPSNSPLISAIPAALSETGPKVSWETTIPVVDRRPMPIRDTRYSDSWRLPLPRATATARARMMARMAATEDSRPIAMPDRTVVAGPVWVDSAISRDGRSLGRGVVLGYPGQHLAEDHTGEYCPEDLEVVDVELGHEEGRRLR